MTMIRKAGIASVKSLQLMKRTIPIISTPTRSSTGEIAKTGTAENSGVKMRKTRNNPATSSELSPLRPPSAAVHKINKDISVIGKYYEFFQFFPI